MIERSGNIIKNVKLFINDNKQSIEFGKLVKDRLLENGFELSDSAFDLGVAIGGDGSFLRMIKSSKFDSTLYYVGINTVHLDFL